MTAGRLYPARPLLAASVALIRDGKLLLAARARPPLQAVFSLPGGLVEAGETMAEAARRELDEETGVDAEIVAFLAPIEFVERDADGRTRHHYVICAHLGRWLSGEPRPGPEALAFRWLSSEEIGTVPTTPGLDPVLHAAFAAASTRLR